MVTSPLTLVQDPFPVHFCHVILGWVSVVCVPACWPAARPRRAERAATLAYILGGGASAGWVENDGMASQAKVRGPRFERWGSLRLTLYWVRPFLPRTRVCLEDEVSLGGSSWALAAARASRRYVVHGIEGPKAVHVISSHIRETGSSKVLSYMIS